MHMLVSLTNLAGFATSFYFLICRNELTALSLVRINLNSFHANETLYTYIFLYNLQKKSRGLFHLLYQGGV